MSLWRQLTRGLRRLVHRDAAYRESSEEAQHYLEEAAAALIARGVPEEAARRHVRLEYGHAAGISERVQDYGWENLAGTFWADLRYGARLLRTHPGSTLAAVLTLALGIGATTAIFSVLHPVLIEALPYPQAGRIMAILENTGTRRTQGTFGMYRSLVERSRSFEAMSVFKPWRPTITGSGQPERFDGQRVSFGYFRVLGVPPVLGRDFQESDDRRRGPNVVILSDALWRRRFNADAAILGRAVNLDGASFSVIGVMPARFENVPAPESQLWAPLQYDLAMGSAWGHHLGTIGRVRPGVTVAQASREMNELGQAVLKEKQPQTYARTTQFSAVTLQSEVTRAVQPALVVLLGAVVLVLFIACVNVTNLLLARGAQRRGEFALRAALGAGRARVVRQLLTESLLLSALGGALGVFVAGAGVRALVALSPPGLPRLHEIGVNGTVLIFALALTTLVGLSFGLIPSLDAARLQQDLGRVVGSRRQRRMRNALVVLEVAFALVLLVGTGLLLRSWERLFAIPPGFNASRLLTMQVQASPLMKGGSFEADLDAVRRLPGVTAAAFTSQLPMSDDLDEYGARFEPNTEQGFGVYRYAVSPGYIETMGIPLRKGRLFTEHDNAGSPRVALLSESLAKTKFGDQDPIGERLHLGPITKTPYQVIGVVGDVKQASLAKTETDSVYIPVTQWPGGDLVQSLVVRAQGDVAAFVPAVREAIWSADRNQAVTRAATMDSLLAAAAAERRFALILFEAFGIVALMLAAVGIYGVLAGSVVERTREIGVRAALGASRFNIMTLVLRHGLVLTALGTLLGLAGAAAASRAMVTLLFGVSRLDPLTYAAVAALLLGVSAAACWAPAWRASRVDPAITLRAE